MRRHLLLPVSAMLVLAAQPAAARSSERKDAEADQDTASTGALYLTLIREARASGRARAALAYLDDFDRTHAGDAEARVLRVNCLLDLNQVEAARAALGRIPSGDRSGPALAVRGHVLAAEGQWPQAAVQYAAALQASPADAFITNALGYARLRSGQAAEAVETLRSAHDLAPDDEVVRNNLILALTMTGRLAEADGLLATAGDAKAKAQLRQQVAGEVAKLASAGAGAGISGGAGAGRAGS
ncbi:tetratricopeptide repeat protein [Novosphingobium resinovorum]|uniref:tetratricopeptide repeat protein n=1 Tax=Novosphingobium resinovorum TaxID=158500 RepID=UPI002ED37749|nr:tetratricopeptide repeat protein [Novosphingobium resinovorum]